MTHGCIVTPRPICHFMSMHIKLAGLRNPKRVTLSGALGEVFRAARLPNPAKIVSAQSNQSIPVILAVTTTTRRKRPPTTASVN